MLGGFIVGLDSRFGQIHVHAEFLAGRVKEIYEALNEELVWAAIQQVINEGVSRVGEISRRGAKGALRSKAFKYKTNSRGDRGQH